jgi:hypothetical protein
MDQKIFVALILMFLLSPIYSMSNDGGNVPVVQKNEIENITQTTSQFSIKPEIENPVNSKITVNEILATKPNGEVIYGKDTGLTQKEYDQFKKDYYQKIEEFGWYKGAQGGSEDVKEQLFKAKVNLNAVNEFEKLGWVNGVPGGYPADILLNGIILLGQTTDSMSYNVDKTGIDNGSVWEFEIDKILKGKDLMNEGDMEGSIVYLNSGLGKKSWNSAEKPYFKNTRYILFIRNFMSKSKTSPDRLYYKGFNSCLVVDGDYVYNEDWYRITKNKPEDRMSKKMNYNEVIETIINFVRLNDSENFYKRNYIDARRK